MRRSGSEKPGGAWPSASGGPGRCPPPRRNGETDQRLAPVASRPAPGVAPTCGRVQSANAPIRAAARRAAPRSERYHQRRAELQAETCHRHPPQSWRQAIRGSCERRAACVRRPASRCSSHRKPKLPRVFMDFGPWIVRVPRRAGLASRAPCSFRCCHRPPVPRRETHAVHLHARRNRLTRRSGNIVAKMPGRQSPPGPLSGEGLIQGGR